MNLVFREATLEDAQLLLDWRNDETTRVSSHNMGLLTLSSHVKWLKDSLNNKHRTILIVELGGVAVGTVRKDELDNGLVELSWTVSPEHRGLGLAKAIVCKVCHETKDKLYAEIKVSNVASLKSAKAAGFRISDEIDGVYHLIR